MKKIIVISLFSIAAFGQVVSLRDNSPRLMVVDWTVGSGTTLTFSKAHNLSVNDSLNCWGFQSQPNLNGDFLVAATPSSNTIALKTPSGEAVQTYNQKFKNYNYNPDQEREPAFQASCGKTVKMTIHPNGPLGMVPPPESKGRIWITDPDGPGSRSAPAMSGIYGQAITKNANDYSSSNCNADQPLSTSNCPKEFYSNNSEVLLGHNAYTVALAWYMNQQNTRWKNSARAFLNNLHNLSPQPGRFTAADTIATHGNRGEASDYSKMAIRSWAMAYTLMESVLSEPEKLAIEQKLFNDDSSGCVNMLPNPSGEATSSGRNRLTLDNVSGWKVGDWGFVRRLQKKFKTADSTITSPIIVEKGKAKVSLSSAHTSKAYIKVSGSGVNALDGTYMAVGTDSIEFDVNGVRDGAYTSKDLEIYSYGLVPNGQGIWFRVTGINGNELSTSVNIVNALNSPYAKVGEWNSKTCGLYWLIRHHDASVPMDTKAVVRLKLPLEPSETQLTVLPLYAGALRGWQPPFTVIAGSEHMLATEVKLPDDKNSPATITVQRGYNNTPTNRITLASTNFIISKSGRISGESTTFDSQWYGSAYQNLRITDHGGVIPALSVFSRRSERIRKMFGQWYNLYQDQILRWAQTHWAGNNTAATNPGYFYGRQVDQVLPACLAAANTVISPDILQTCRTDFKWMDDIHLWPIHITQPYNKRYRMMFSDSGTARFIDARHHNPSYVSYLAPGKTATWGNFHNRRVTKQALSFLGPNNRNLHSAIMYEPYIEEEDYRTNSSPGAVWYAADPEARKKGYGISMLSSRTSFNDPDATATWSYAFAPQGDHLGTYNPLGSYQVTKRAEMICTGTRGCISSLSQSGMRVFSSPGFSAVPPKASSTLKEISIRLSEVAPEGGIVVELSSSDPSITVPTWVTIPSGKDSVTVNAISYLYSGSQTSQIVGKSANSKSSILVSPNQFSPGITATGTVKAITFDEKTITQGSYIQGIVTLAEPAGASGVDVKLSASDELPVTSVVRIRKGLTSAPFFVSASPSTRGNLSITATSANSVKADVTVVSSQTSKGQLRKGMIAAIITGRDTRSSAGVQTNGLRTYVAGGTIAKVTAGGTGEDYTWWQLLGQDGPTNGFYADGTVDYHLRQHFHLRPDGQDYVIVHNVAKSAIAGRELVDRIAFYRGNSFELEQEAVVSATTQERSGREITFIKPETPTRKGGASITTKILLPDLPSISDDFSQIDKGKSYGAAVDIYYGNDASQYKEGLWIHKPQAGTGPTKVEADLIEKTSDNITAALIEKSHFISFSKRHNALTSARFSVENSQKGSAHMTGFAAGTYQITRNGTKAETACVIEPDRLLKFPLEAGTSAYEISQISPTPCKQALWWVTQSLPDQVEKSPFRFKITTEGGSGSSTFALSSGSLPPGINMNTSGVVEGSASRTGAFPFTVKVTDGSNTFERKFTLNIVSSVIEAPVNETPREDEETPEQSEQEQAEPDPMQ